MMWVGQVRSHRLYGDCEELADVYSGDIELALIVGPPGRGVQCFFESGTTIEKISQLSQNKVKIRHIHC